MDSEYGIAERLASGHLGGKVYLPYSSDPKRKDWFCSKQMKDDAAEYRKAHATNRVVGSQPVPAFGMQKVWDTFGTLFNEQGDEWRGHQGYQAFDGMLRRLNMNFKNQHEFWRNPKNLQVEKDQKCFVGEMNRNDGWYKVPLHKANSIRKVTDPNKFTVNKPTSGNYDIIDDLVLTSVAPVLGVRCKEPDLNIFKMENMATGNPLNDFTQFFGNIGRVIDGAIKAIGGQEETESREESISLVIIDPSWSDLGKAVFKARWYHVKVVKKYIRSGIDTGAEVTCRTDYSMACLFYDLSTDNEICEAYAKMLSDGKKDLNPDDLP